MDDQCMVIIGDWVCGNKGKWDFVVEKQQMGRMVPMYDGVGYMDLKSSVLREFGVDETRFSVPLSYWPPTTVELATGMKTPPVILTSDGAVGYFLHHFKVKGGMNLFARFEKKTVAPDDDGVDDSGLGFVTPSAMKSCCRVQCGSSRAGYVSSAASKTNVYNVEDAEFVREVEKVEQSILGGSKRSSEADGSGGSLGSEDDLNSGVELDELDIRPIGYDMEFWSPLTDGEGGGSDAVYIF